MWWFYIYVYLVTTYAQGKFDSIPVPDMMSSLIT